MYTFDWKLVNLRAKRRAFSRRARVRELVRVSATRELIAHVVAVAALAARFGVMTLPAPAKGISACAREKMRSKRRAQVAKCPSFYLELAEALKIK